MQQKKIASISFAAMLCLLTGMCTGCTSIKARRGVNSDILEYQRKIDKLESTIRNYEAAIDDTIREITDLRNRAEDMGATIDDVIELFGQYQQLVERLLRDYNSLRSAVKDAEQSSGCAISYNYHPSSIYVYWLYTIPEGCESAEMDRYITLAVETENGRRAKEKV